MGVGRGLRVLIEEYGLDSGSSSWVALAVATSGVYWTGLGRVLETAMAGSSGALGQVRAGHTESQGVGHVLLGLHLTLEVQVVLRTAQKAKDVTGFSTIVETAVVIEGALAKLGLRIMLGIDKGMRRHVVSIGTRTTVDIC